MRRNHGHKHAGEVPDLPLPGGRATGLSARLAVQFVERNGEISLIFEAGMGDEDLTRVSVIPARTRGRDRTVD
jgi:hypothetical protein